MIDLPEDRGDVDILACGNMPQRERLAHHRAVVPGQPEHALYELVTQSLTMKDRRNRRGRNGAKFRLGRFVEATPSGVGLRIGHHYILELGWFGGAHAALE